MQVRLESFYGGSETFIREDIQVARLFTKSVTPKITSSIPEEIPCAQKFNFC